MNPQSQIHNGGVEIEVKIMELNKNKSILHWNCCGFRPNFEEEDTDNVNIRGFNHYFILKRHVKSTWESHWWLLHIC